jgi:glycosyltransferase involved in cell wall biosynthesis
MNSGPHADFCFTTGGPADVLRMRRLTSGMTGEWIFYPFDASKGRFRAAWILNRALKSAKRDLVYMEGTGIAGGAILIWRALVARQKFVVSSGDPIGGFFKVTRGPTAGMVFGLYERLLYKACAGFIGWTPYLTGAAMQMGARRAVTVEGGVDLEIFRPLSPELKLAARKEFGLPPGSLVCGTVGSLSWTERQSYCYGLELIETLKRTTRPDLHVLIVGDGNGRKRLEALVPDALRDRIAFTGRLPEEKVVQAMNAMDIGFITQTLDALGSFRLTTKLPEYLACGLPVAMSPIPGFYDYAADAGWALPAFHPARPEFHALCASWLDGLERSEIEEKGSRARRIAEERFDYRWLKQKFQRFVEALFE